MCPWCFVTPACPCRRGGRTHVYGPIGPALVAVARRLRRKLSPGAAGTRHHVRGHDQRRHNRDGDQHILKAPRA